MTRQSTANVPAHGGGPAAQDSTRNESAPNPDDDDAGFIFPRGATTPLASAMPKSNEPFTVPMSNTWDTYAEAFSDGKDNTTVAPDATTPTKFKEAHRAAEDSLDSILKELWENKAAHQCCLDKCFKIYSSDEQERHQKFEYRQSTFLTEINKKMRAVELAISRMATNMVSVANRFTTIDATLTKVKESTNRMSGLLESNCAQLHQLRDNKHAQVVTMQEHCDCLDNMDAILSRVYESVTKTNNLAQELDSKITASRHTAQDEAKRPATNPPTPGFVSPTRHTERDTTRLTDSTMPLPDEDTNAGKKNPPLASSALHRFANVNLGPGSLMSQRASSYPLGNRSSRSPPVDPRKVQFENPANYCFDNPCPSALDTSNNTHDSAIMGGHIESPRPSNKERQARNHRTSLFNVAGLASSNYHGGPWGNQTLEIPFIHSCGYQSIRATEGVRAYP
jgi:hypothetical protein